MVGGFFVAPGLLEQASQRGVEPGWVGASSTARRNRRSAPSRSPRTWWTRPRLLYALGDSGTAPRPWRVGPRPSPGWPGRRSSAPGRGRAIPGCCTPRGPDPGTPAPRSSTTPPSRATPPPAPASAPAVPRPPPAPPRRRPLARAARRRGRLHRQPARRGSGSRGTSTDRRRPRPRVGPHRSPGQGSAGSRPMRPGRLDDLGATPKAQRR